MSPDVVVIQPNIPPPDHPAVVKMRAILKTGTQYTQLTNEATPDALPLECFDNARRAAEANGGDAVYGWRVVETLPGVLMEAEFHAVWRDREGELHEVSPPIMEGVDQTLFLADPNRIHEGVQVDNLRIALRKDSLIARFIKAAQERYKALNKDNLAHQYGEIALTPELREIHEKLRQLNSEIKQKYFM